MKAREPEGAAARWPALTRLGAIPARLFAARLAVRWRIAAAVVATIQLAALALLSLTAAARPYEGLWLKLAAATWFLWFAPFALFLAKSWSLRRAGKHSGSLDDLAAELDRLNPAAPDVFRTARRPDVHNTSTLDALETLFKTWEPRLVVPAASRVFGRDLAGMARRFGLSAAILLFAVAALIPAFHPAPDSSPAGYGGRAAGLLRMLAPLSALAAVPAPRLTPVGLPSRVARGDTVDIEVEVAHVPRDRPVHARLILSGDGPGPQRGPREVRYELAGVRGAAAKGSANTRRFRYGPVNGDFSVRFTALNASSRSYDVEMVTPPRLQTLTVTITPPAYTRLPRETREVAPARLALLPGTRLVWSGTADRDVHVWSASWTSPGTPGADSGRRPVPRADASRSHGVIARGNGREVRWERMIRSPGAVTLRLEDKTEEGGARAEEGPWHIDLRADAAPEITLLTPEGDGELPRGLKVPLVFRATDDFGVGAVRLHTVWRDAEGRVRAQGSRVITGWLDARDGRGAGVWDGAGGVAGNGPALTPQAGETIELTLEAADNDAVNGPKSARSATVSLRLPSAEEVAAQIGARERDAAAGLASAMEREKRAERALQAADKGKQADAPPTAGEWDVRRVLSDEPRRHLQELRRQLDTEIRQAEQGVSRLMDAPGQPGQHTLPPHPPGDVKSLKDLKREAEAMEKRLPVPEIARAPLPERRRALEALSRDQKALDDKMKSLRAEEASRKKPAESSDKTPSKTSPDAQAREKREERARREQEENRARLEDDLRRQIGEQEDLKKWLAEQERTEAAKAQRAEAAARQQDQAREDVREALEQIDEAMRKGLENGTLGPEVLEKMDRIRELLEEVLDEGEKERLRRESAGDEPGAEDLERAMRELVDKKDGLKKDLERAIRMLETMRDQRALRDLSEEVKSLEAGQKELARALDAADQPDQSPARLANEQEDLQKRLEQAQKRQESLAARPAMKPLRKESLPQKMREARAGMQKASEQLRKAKSDRQNREARAGAKSGADLAAKKLAEAAAEMEKALASMDQGADMAEVRAVLEETLEFTRWLEGATNSSTAATTSGLSFPSPTGPDAASSARIARWLSGRIDKLAAARPFESDALRRASLGMAAYADALATSVTSGASAASGTSATSPDTAPLDLDALAGVRRHARAAARELLKWLSDQNGGGGENEGDGQGDSEFGGGDQGESGNEGSDGVARRMRGMSGQQMAANRLTQELLRELMRERGNAGGPGEPGGASSGSTGGRPSGSQGGSQAGNQQGTGGGGRAADQGVAGGPGGARAGQGPGQSGPGGESSPSSPSSSSARGAAANAQQQIADALESLAEGADDGGGAARKLRQLAEEARALERALRGGRLDPEALRKRQEQFRTRLLESADAMEERGQQRERRAEAYRGGITPATARSLPLDSLAAELRRRREDARRLPLTPEQKRRVEWYYERLIGDGP